MNSVIKTHPTLNGFFSDVMNNFLKDDAITAPLFGNTPVNITETEHAYELELVAPGREKNDFNVQLKDNVLTISFEKKTSTEQETKKSVRREFRLDSFKRSFTINDKVDASNISAAYVNGILKLTLPKKEDVKASAATIAVQ